MQDTPTRYEMTFGTIECLEPGIVEVVVNGDVMMDGNMVNECEGVLKTISGSEVGILVNKKNPYTHDEEAKHMLATLGMFKAMAVLLTGWFNSVPAKYLMSIPVDVTTPVQLFHDRDEALSWLREQVAQPA
ncbi:MAG: hypothetical protein R2834_07030 [Rhodothermales bacterium]